jgi:hypothetical protein
MSKSLKDMTQTLFHTPENMKALQDYLALFSGGEAVTAQVCAWQAWNLACEYARQEDEDRLALQGAIAETLQQNSASL